MSDQYTITEQYHEKKGTYIYVVRLINKIDKDEFIIVRDYAKNYNGYYSSYRGVNGFVFQTEADAKEFGDIIDAMFSNAPITCDGSHEDDGISYDNPPKAVIDNGMPLHKALRNVILTEGKDIVKELRLVNILDDFHAYESISASKYILRAIIADGYSTKLLSLGMWNNKALNLVDRFIQNTGFIKESATGIFQSIAFGLGWINEIKSYPNSSASSSIPNKPTQPQLQTPRKQIKKLWNSDMDEDETNDFFMSITEIDNETANSFGVEIENLCFFLNTSGNISLSCEIVRKSKKKNKDYAFLHYALYDAKGRVASTDYHTVMQPESPNSNPIIIGLELSPEDISRIRLYFQ